MSFKLIPTVEDELVELTADEKAFLVVASTWEHADVAILDPNDLVWYSPIDGSDMFPPPTHYMEIPKL